MTTTPPEQRLVSPAPEPGRNRNTVYHGALALPDPSRVYAALELARRTVQAAPRPGAPGIHVFGAHRGDLHVRFLPASPDEHLVIGRHEECDLRLRADPAVSLRHLVARAIRLEDGTAALRLIDLATPLPFFLPEGRAQRALVASGPFAVALGDYVVGGIPDEVERYDTRGGPYRAPALVESAQRVPRRALVGPGGARRSRITLLPHSRLITHVPAWPATGGAAVVVPPDPAARVTLRRGTAASSIALDEGALARGVLIGRAPRCLDRGLRTVLSTSISRVHLLLLREDDGATDVAIDLASTQGTYAAGARLRGARLRGASCRLTLGYVDPVRLTFDRRGERPRPPGT